MSLIELILTMPLYDFSVPQTAELNSVIDQYLRCQQVTEYTPECAGFLQKYNEMKDQMDSEYVNFQ